MRVVRAMTTGIKAPAAPAASTPDSLTDREIKKLKKRSSPYPMWFFAPAAVVYTAMFVVPTFASFYFALTRWTIFDSTFIGLDNFRSFFSEPFLYKSLVNTMIYAVLTSGAKVVLGLLIAVFLTSTIVARGWLRSVVFFPVLISAVGIGVTFSVLLNPFEGLVNHSLAAVGITGPGWLTDPHLALYSVAMVDIWRGVGLATLIYIAGIAAIPPELNEAAKVDGANAVRRFWSVTLPLMRPATTTVIILSLIGGLRSFDLIWTMTHGGPGFSSDVLASMVYKQYQAGFYGLSTAGNVVLFVLVAAIIIPLFWFLNRKEVER
jgi:raffinose/stachyose/melibiose transport system permease protein